MVTWSEDFVSTIATNFLASDFSAPGVHLDERPNYNLEQSFKRPTCPQLIVLRLYEGGLYSAGLAPKSVPKF